MINPILENNLAVIEKYNSELAYAIRETEIKSKNFSLGQTSKNEPNLIYNGIAIHDTDGAEEEAENIFTKANDSKITMHVIFGFGLGYLPQAFTKSKGCVIVYEPDIELLRVVLEIVDFKKELSTKNLFIVNTSQQLKQIFSTNYIYNSKQTFSSLPTYRNIYGENINKYIKEVQFMAGMCITDFNTLKKTNQLMLETVLNNFSDTLNETPIENYKDIYKGETAIIVSGGPTLDKNITELKNNREKYIIFSVGTAAKTLLNNEIKPDFINVIETYDCSAQLQNIDIKDIPLIIEPYTNSAFHKMNNPKILFATSTTFANKLWAKLTENDISQNISKGTVSHEALCCAKLMGFSKIILVGQDLAYTEGQCYSKSSNYRDLACIFNNETQKYEIRPLNFDNYVNEIFSDNFNNLTKEFKEKLAKDKIKNLNETLYMVKGIQGNELPTEGGYATFIEHFKDFARENQDLELINTSMIGAKIDGFKDIPLADAVKNLNKIEKIQLKEATNYDISKLTKIFSNEIKLFSNLEIELTHTIEQIEGFEKEFNRRNMLNDSAGKYFKQLLSLYKRISSTYKQQSLIYAGLMTIEDLDVNFALQSSQKVDSESILKVFKALKSYYLVVTTRLNVIKKILTTTIGEINERLATKS